MTVSCGPFSSQNQLRCTFPECKCDACQKSRATTGSNCSTSKMSKGNPCSERLQKGKTGAPCAAAQSAQGSTYSDNSLSDFLNDLFHYEFEPENIFSVLFDIIATVAFLIMAAIAFWLMLTEYVWRLIVTIYNAGRKTQICTFVVCALMLLHITFCAIQGHRAKHLRQLEQINHSPSSSNPPDNAHHSTKHHDATASNENFKKSCTKNCPKKKNCPGSTDTNTKSSNAPDTHVEKLKKREKGGADGGKLKQQSSESLCELCARHFAKCTSSKTSMNDDEVKKMYFKYNLASVPMEWKTPPEPIVYFMDYIKQIFSSSENSETNE